MIFKFYQQIGLRLYAISIHYTRLFTIITIIYDYLRLFYYKNQNDYTRLSQSRIISLIALWLFHLLFSAYIIAIVVIIHDYVHYFYRKLLYLLFYLRWNWSDELLLFFSEPIMSIMCIISQLFELCFCLTIITIIFFQCYYTRYFFPTHCLH